MNPPYRRQKPHHRQHLTGQQWQPLWTLGGPFFRPLVWPYLGSHVSPLFGSLSGSHVSPHDRSFSWPLGGVLVWVLGGMLVWVLRKAPVWVLGKAPVWAQQCTVSRALTGARVLLLLTYGLLTPQLLASDLPASDLLTSEMLASDLPASDPLTSQLPVFGLSAPRLAVGPVTSDRITSCPDGGSEPPAAVAEPDSITAVPEPDSITEVTEPAPGTTVITAEEIRLRGITRMDELFSLIDTWSGYGINGQDWRATSPGQGIYGGAEWSLWIDRHPVPLSTLGWHSVNHLPVAILEIERVVVLDTPQVYEGVFVGQGLIHIITRRGRMGMRSDARLAVANEINDPGPWEFTDRTSPNVERSGPDIDLVTGYRSDRWHLQASGSLLRHRNTDVPIEQRIKEMLFVGDGFAAPTSRREALQLRGGVEAGQLQIRFHGGTYHHRDLPFYRSLGREVPVLFTSLHGGIDLNLPVGQIGDLYLRSSWQKREPSYLPNRDAFRFRHLQQDHTHQATLSRSGEHRQLSATLQLDQTTADGAVGEAFDAVRIGSLHAQWAEQVTRRLLVSGAGRLAAARGEEALSVALHASWQLTDRHRLQPWIARHAQLASEQRDMLFWTERGYPTSAHAIQTVTTGLEWHYRISSSSHLSIQGVHHHHDNLRLQRYRFTIVHPWQWFRHDGGTTHEEEWASTLGLNLKAHVGQNRRLRHTLFIGMRTVTGGSAEMRRALDEIPVRRMRLTTTWLPVRGFHLWGSLRLQSGTTWHEFEGVDGERITDQQELVERTFHYQTDSVVDLEVGSSKSLWSDRAALTLMVRNLLNRPLHSHPAGAGMDLTFTLQMSVSL